MEDIAAKAATKTTQVMKRKEVEGELNFVTDLKSEPSIRNFRKIILSLDSLTPKAVTR